MKPEQSVELARKILSAENKPVAKFDWNTGKFVWLVEYNYHLHHNVPLYLYPPDTSFDLYKDAINSIRGLLNKIEELERERDYSNDIITVLQAEIDRMNT